jgi:two-component system phosphate regulon sensor histidine kinase PhoR
MKAVVETLEDGALEDPLAARTFLGRLHGEIDQLTELVRELLELSRIESGQAEIEPVATDLGALLSAAVQRLDALAQRNGIELRLRLPAELPPALADPPRIGQVLANLLHNAIKFTPPGGQVELRASCQAAELTVSVTDTGIGIPPDDLDRVFERFFKSDRSRSSGGTGLGLAIAKHLIQAHGGRIWAESGGVRGTTFTFTLPLAVAAISPAPVGESWQRS